MKVFYNIKRWFILNYYRGCLKETKFRVERGHTNLDFAIRFFKFKVFKYSKR